MMRSFAIAALASLAAATGAAAQQCTPPDLSCNQMLEASEVLQVRSGIGFAGGNPVPGATSTLGMRIGRVPRVTVAARLTGVGLDMPGLSGNEDEFKSMATSFNLDAAVGVFSGIALAPTIGGFGSIDAVASLGKQGQSKKHGLDSDPMSWALGVRLGVLRESFTAPGISVTAMYRHIGDMTGTGRSAPSLGTSGFELTGNSVRSVRAVVGKRLFVVGANLGLGYDSYRSDVLAHGVDYRPVDGSYSTFTDKGRSFGRTTAFVNATWTTLILNLIAEGGIQQGGDRFTAPLSQGQSSKTQNRGYYGSLAVRLAL